jgi:hypothetical protein
MKRPSLATVLATLALFFSLSGTAMASLLITKNNQVAPHVIAGANGPSGSNKNLISGSVGSSDLHAGAVTKSKLGSDSVGSSKIADGSITGSDLNTGQVSSALGLQTALTTTQPGSGISFFSSTPFLLVGNCTNDGGGNVHASVEFDNLGSDKVFLTVGSSAGEVVGPSGVATNALAQTPSSNQTQVRGGEFSSQELGFANHISGRVIAGVDFDDSSFQGAPMTAPFCFFRFDGRT